MNIADMKIRKNASRLFVQSLAMLALASGGFRPAIAASFLDTGPLARSRSFHTATLLQDGTVLAAGGFGSGGFLALLVPPEKQHTVRDALKDLLEVKFRFENEGSTIVYMKDKS